MKNTDDQFSLLGHWAQNCEREATKGNWHLEYSLDKSGDIIRRMFRDDEERFSTIKKLKAIDSYTLSIHEVYGNGWGDYAGVTKDYKLHFTEDYMTYQSISSTYDGELFIKDGKMAHTGKDSPIVYRCLN